jgi:hypothetical protein
MRIAAGILTFLIVTAAANGQPTSTQQAQPTIRNLTIISDDLAAADRLRIAHSLQGTTCDPDEMQERVRRKLRDLGFYYAQVETPEFSPISQPEGSQSPAADGIDVSIKVLPGAQYRFGVIEFKHATAFAPNTLRSQFPIEAGSLFNVTSVSYGLNRLRNLYQANGHINFGAIPMPTVDEKHHVVNLTIDLDEGKSYVFGQLTLAGTEPHAGDGNALASAWGKLQGKAYDPDLLKDWLASNWPSGNEGLSHMQAIPDERPPQVNFRLQFR